jgi:hypothetical protein
MSDATRVCWNAGRDQNVDAPELGASCVRASTRTSARDVIEHVPGLDSTRCMSCMRQGCHSHRSMISCVNELELDCITWTKGRERYGSLNYTRG